MLHSEYLQAALQDGADWLESSDIHFLARIGVVDGVSTLFLFLDKESPGKVRFRNSGKQQSMPIAEFISEVIPSLSLEIQRIDLNKYVKENDSWRDSIQKVIFQTAPNDRQARELEDLAKFQDTHRKLIEKLHPV